MKTFSRNLSDTCKTFFSELYDMYMHSKMLRLVIEFDPIDFAANDKILRRENLALDKSFNNPIVGLSNER